MGRRLDYGRAYDSQHHVSGGQLQVPKTPAERLVLIVRLRRLKAEFLRRQAGR